ncbi:UNKNOWN [Stylonychia lemnae]|uniref:EF-hand domain-containing protein n=1 Tax=Stylonychia lemnae TaxID=5949 RepID=A0A077ZTP9_STYLE|nr:UNKNOWN [Stylonychia lemnae]|eukprot:CDW72904.1 UNKNOWN [Stylonychia lemnae]
MSRGQNGEKMLLLNNSPGHQMNINIQNNQAQYMNTIQGASGKIFNQYQQNPQHVIQMIQQKQASKNPLGQRNLRPQSAKPAKNNVQLPHENSIYGTNFQVIKNQTLRNDYGGELNFARVNQIKSRLNSKLGVPYMQTIKAAHRYDYGIAQNQQLRQRPMSGKVKKELITRERMINEIVATGKLQTKMNQDQVMKAKDSEIELLKRNIRSTRLEEAEKTVQFFIQEGARLRAQLESTMSQGGQSQAVMNRQGLSQQQIADDQNNQVMINSLQQQINQQSSDIGILNENLAAKDKEIQIWRQRCEKELKEKSKSASSKEKLPISKDEYNHLKQKLTDLQNVYEQTLLENQTLTDKIEDIQNQVQNQSQKRENELLNKITELQNNSKDKENEINTLRTTMNNLLQQVEQLEQKLKQQTAINEHQIKELKQQLEENIRDDVDNYDDDLKQQEFSQKLNDLQEQHQREIKQLQEQSKKQYLGDLEKQRTDMLQLHKKQLEQQILLVQEENNKSIEEIRQTYVRQLKDKQLQLDQIEEELKNVKQQLANTTNQYESNLQSKQGSILVQNQSISQHQKLNSVSSSHHSLSIVNQSSVKYESKSIIKEEQVKQNFEHIKRKLQLEKVSKDQLQEYLFEGQNQNRENISIKDFSSILFAKLLLDQSQANNLARYIIEKPDDGSSEIDYDQNKTLMNRKIIKVIHDKILGPQYQIYTHEQEKHVLKKYRELAQDHQEYFENTLNLYDFEGKGLMTVDDLREALLSQEIYDGRDKISFECFALYLLTINHKDTFQIKINDVLDALFPNRDQPRVQKNKMSQSTITNKSHLSQQQIQSQKSLKQSTTIKHMEKQKSILDNDEDLIQEEVYDDQVQYDEAPPELNYLKSMNEEELLEKSEKAFQMISQYLQNNNISLRNVLKDQIYDQKINIINEEQEGQESQRANKTFEVINAEDFFQKVQVEDLSESLKDSVMQIAGKQVPDQNQNFFIYKDLEEILGAYGFIDSIKPRNSRNLKYDLLDPKSIRIMNRLEQFLQDNNMILIQLFEDKIYQKTINNSQLGTNQKKNFKLKFIKSREFFDRLKDLNIRRSGEPLKNLVEFLTIDSKTYKTGLVVKKIEKLLKECKENEYLQSIGTNKRSKIEQIQPPQGQSRLSQINQMIDEPIEEQYQEEYDSIKEATLHDDQIDQLPKYTIEQEEDKDEELLESLQTLPDIKNPLPLAIRPNDDLKYSQSDAAHTVLDHKYTQYGIIEDPSGAIKFSGSNHRTIMVEAQKLYDEDIIDDQIVNQYSESEENYEDCEF